MQQSSRRLLVIGAFLILPATWAYLPVVASLRLYGVADILTILFLCVTLVDLALTEIVCDFLLQFGRLCGRTGLVDVSGLLAGGCWPGLIGGLLHYDILVIWRSEAI